MRAGTKGKISAVQVPKFSSIILIAVVVLLLAFRVQGAFAWQLGMYTDDSSGYYGSQSNQYVTGYGESGTFVAAVSGLTDGYSVWHATGVLAWNVGSSDYVDLEYEYESGGTYHDVVYCTGSLSTYYNDTMRWVSSSTEWLYSSSGCGTDLAVTESSSGDTINSAGTVNMMESKDNTSSDFTDTYPEVIMSPGLVYMTSSGGWVDPRDIAAYNNGGSVVSNVGQYLDCTPSAWALVEGGYTQYSTGADGQIC